MPGSILFPGIPIYSFFAFMPESICAYCLASSGEHSSFPYLAFSYNSWSRQMSVSSRTYPAGRSSSSLEESVSPAVFGGYSPALCSSSRGVSFPKGFSLSERRIRRLYSFLIFLSGDRFFSLLPALWVFFWILPQI